MTTSEMQDFLTTIMRSIDKKTALRVEAMNDPERPRVTVHLQRDKRTGTLEISEADLRASKDDMMQRNRLRTTLKRARDRMWEETRPIFSTKVEHHKMEGTPFFRPMQGGRGRR